MKIIEGKEKEYADWKAKNDDPYGGACFLYAEAWADLVEKALVEGKKLEDVAKDLSHEADKNFGITGFMYGAAVQILSLAWVHGEELRRWHNLDCQIEDEGEKATDRRTEMGKRLMVRYSGELMLMSTMDVPITREEWDEENSQWDEHEAEVYAEDALQDSRADVSDVTVEHFEMALIEKEVHEDHTVTVTVLKEWNPDE